MAAKKNSMLVASVMLLTFVPQIVYGKTPPGHSKQASAKATKVFPEDRALALVEKVKEVQVWQKAFGPQRFNPKTQGRPGFNIEDHHGSVYTINVFEDMPEHNVTFARYEANIASGSVKKVD